MLDLSKALYTDLEIELFNTYLYKILTNKEINFKNEAPTQIDINLYPDTNYSSVSILRYCTPNEIDPYNKIKHNFELRVIVSDDTITDLQISFYNKITDTVILLGLNNLTKTNIKLLLEIYKKWTKINFKQHKYNYNK